MIFLSTQQYDPLGFVRVEPGKGSDFGQLTRRANRVATLDGAAVTNDFGYTDADRTFVVRAQVTEDQNSRLERMVRFHKRVKVATREGFFLAILAYRPGVTDAEIKLTIISRLDEE